MAVAAMAPRRRALLRDRRARSARDAALAASWSLSVFLDPHHIRAVSSRASSRPDSHSLLAPLNCMAVSVARRMHAVTNEMEMRVAGRLCPPLFNHVKSGALFLLLACVLIALSSSSLAFTHALRHRRPRSASRLRCCLVSVLVFSSTRQGSRPEGNFATGKSPFGLVNHPNPVNSVALTIHAQSAHTRRPLPSCRCAVESA